MAGKLQRLSNALRTGIAVAMLTVTTFAAAQGLRGDHPDTYVVQRGDTLWDIAGQFLQKPWLWPEIWQANPQIRNPHLIYPGDVISLAYLNRVGLTPGPRTEAAPINAIPLSEVEPFLKDLRVVDAFDHMPYVVGLEEDRLRASRGQVAYVKGLEGASPGTRYTVLRPTVRYTHLLRSGFCCDTFGRDDLDATGRRQVDWGQYWANVVMPDKGQEELGHELMRVTAGIVTRGEVDGIQASTLLLDEEVVSASSGKKIHRLVAKKPGLEIRE
jgi:hypothetical protein